MATHSSFIAWRIPWTEEPGRLQSTGSQRVGHDWATSPSPYLTISTILYQGSPCNVITYLTPGKGMATTPVSLSRKSHGQKSLAGSSPWGSRVGHDLARNPPPTMRKKAVVIIQARMIFLFKEDAIFLIQPSESYHVKLFHILFSLLKAHKGFRKHGSRKYAWMSGFWL